MAKFSIIIPVYNAERYLRECIDSVVNQTFRDIEIVCVNDGSTDNSLSILEEYAGNDERIKIINQENKGHSGARNAGLDNISGEYCCFLDSDDYFELNLLERANEIFEKFDIDLFCFGSEIFGINDNFVTSITDILEKDLSIAVNYNAIDEILEKEKSRCLNIIRKVLLHNYSNNENNELGKLTNYNRRECINLQSQLNEKQNLINDLHSKIEDMHGQIFLLFNKDKIFRKYYRYKFFSKMFLGKKRKHYKEKTKIWHEKVRLIRTISKNEVL